MIERDITPCLARLFEQYPFVTVTGPRQSGKTTLCRATFPHLKYVNLEAPDQREFARSDPRGFLSQIDNGAILDEIQRVPDLLSYLQVFADENGGNGLFILTGSEHFKLSEAITQSLAGRTGLLRLLPFSLAERQRTGAGNATEEILYSGFYPRIYDKGLEPHQAFSDYFETYVERDVRRLGEIRNLSSFRRFVRLCAGRIGQLTNLVALGSDAGVSHTTARHWLGVLEASFIAFRLPPFHANVRKRLVKSPKLYFYDVGFAAYLIGIERAEQIATHPLRGALFENMVVVEALLHIRLFVSTIGKLTYPPVELLPVALIASVRHHSECQFSPHTRRTQPLVVRAIWFSTSPLVAVHLEQDLFHGLCKVGRKQVQEDLSAPDQLPEGVEPL